MRKDITIARVSWGLRDVVRALLLVVLIPIITFAFFIVLSKIGVIPKNIVEAVKTNDILFSALVELIVLGAEAGVLIWIAKKRQAKLADFGFRKFNVIKTILFIIGSFLVLSAIVAIVYAVLVWLWPSFNANEAQDVGFEYGKAGIGLWFSFFSTVVLAPVVEEIYFRGFIMPATTKRFGWLIGITVSAVLFAILHLQLNVIVYTFVFGIILAALYIKTKSIIPSIILHIMNNLIAFSILAGWIR